VRERKKAPKGGEREPSEALTPSAHSILNRPKKRGRAEKEEKAGVSFPRLAYHRPTTGEGKKKKGRRPKRGRNRLDHRTSSPSPGHDGGKDRKRRSKEGKRNSRPPILSLIALPLSAQRGEKVHVPFESSGEEKENTSMKEKKKEGTSCRSRAFFVSPKGRDKQ